MRRQRHAPRAMRARLALLLGAAGGCAGIPPADTGGAQESRDGSETGDGAAGTDGPGLPPLPLAAVVITEIMYHPANEAADQENHEFVEVYNRDTKAIALGRWQLRGKHGLSFTFPENARLMPGQYA